MLIYLGSTLLLLYLAHINYFPGRTYWYLSSCPASGFSSQHDCSVSPHTHKKVAERPESYHNSAEMYLKDSVREPMIYAIIFLCVYLIHKLNNAIEGSALGMWMQNNAMAISLLIALVPMFVFLWVFARTVQFKNIFGYLFHWKAA